MEISFILMLPDGWILNLLEENLRTLKSRRLIVHDIPYWSFLEQSHEVGSIITFNRWRNWGSENLSQYSSNFNVYINRLGILLKSDLGSVGLVWGLKVYISNNLPRLAEAAFLGVTLRGAR